MTDPIRDRSEGGTEPRGSASVDRQQTGVTVGSVDHHPMGVMGSKPKREPCRCPAYSWPHRRGGGRCRWPDPPEAPHPTPAGKNRPTELRSRGSRREVMRYYGLHPIRDRAVLDTILPVLRSAWNVGHVLRPAEFEQVLKATNRRFPASADGPESGT